MAVDAGLHTLQRGFGQRTTPLQDTITALAFVIEAKDPYTRGHCEEVSWWAAKIALQVGLPETEIQDIKLAAIVHDIGKINVPEDVLHKPALLTAQEFEKMKSHAAWGSKILETLKEKGIARIVRHHHERYDGKGYPDRLQGEEIPLGARIVAVAESFHCMVRGSRYKSACTVEDALAELSRCSGTQLDPRVVMALRDWIKIHGDSPCPSDGGKGSRVPEKTTRCLIVRKQLQ
jgi:putative nucleotidyltransferase with HDIG domain